MLNNEFENLVKAFKKLIFLGITVFISFFIWFLIFFLLGR